MINIKINEYIAPDDPNLMQIHRPQIDVFVDGFKQLCNACGMNTVTLQSLPFTGTKIPVNFKFNDGTLIGISKLLSECGFENLGV